MNAVAGPVRTCIGCRERAGKANLLKIVLSEDGIVLDHRQRMPGRGAWIHPSGVCAGLATRRRAWSRALRYSGSVEVSAVQEFLTAAV